MDLTADWEYIQEVAKTRLRNNKTKWHVSQYGEEIETLGAAGELAARRFFGLPENLHTHHDDGVDLHWRGRTVDVKSTHLTNKVAHRYLQWRERKIVKAEIVLMAGVDMKTRQAAILGYVFKDEIKRAPINYNRDFPCHEIPVPELHPSWELLVLREHSYQWATA
jgi:hypothetical protein